MPPNRATLWPVLLAVTALLAGCKPDLETPLSIVGAPRVIAVEAEPPEAAPAAPVTYRALVVSSAGELSAPSLRWAYCLSPRPLTENNVVSTACLAPETGQPFGEPAAIATATAPIPTDACRLFGPDVPPAPAGQPAFRPRDPDVTGGYYQPVRVELEGQVSFALERLRCNLAGAPLDVAADYATRYAANRNPSLLPIAASVDGRSVALDHLPAGRRVTFTAAWSAESVETYPIFELERGALVEHRESMRVSWFATAGAFETEHCGTTEQDFALGCASVWGAPAAGLVHLWVVLRDSRGGVDVAGYDLGVD